MPVRAGTGPPIAGQTRGLGALAGLGPMADSWQTKLGVSREPYKIVRNWSHPILVVAMLCETEYLRAHSILVGGSDVRKMPHRLE